MLFKSNTIGKSSQEVMIEIEVLFISIIELMHCIYVQNVIVRGAIDEKCVFGLVLHETSSS